MGDIRDTKLNPDAPLISRLREAYRIVQGYNDFGVIKEVGALTMQTVLYHQHDELSYFALDRALHLVTHQQTNDATGLR